MLRLWMRPVVHAPRIAARAAAAAPRRRLLVLSLPVKGRVLKLLLLLLLLLLPLRLIMVIMMMVAQMRGRIVAVHLPLAPQARLTAPHIFAASRSSRRHRRPTGAPAR